MRSVFRGISIATVLGLACPSLPIAAATMAHDQPKATAPASQDAPLTLYYREECPHCWKVISYLNDQHRSIAMKELNEAEANANELVSGGGKRQVPCLRIREQNGDRVTWQYQSADIIHYLEQHPDTAR